MSDKNIDACRAVITKYAKQKPLPRKLLLYTLAIEDRRFYSHKGFDLLSIIRVIIFRFLGQRKGGASTIGQQLVRTITNDREKNLARKFREIKLSRKIDHSFLKNEILETYLRIAYLGPSIYGVEDFAFKIFNKSMEELSDDQLAIIASSLRYPYNRHIHREWTVNVRRRAEYARIKAYQKEWIK